MVIGALVAGGAALWDASRLSWVCDDAFISYRYAENLVQGDGLVFNVGERVEGYTNFLWTLLTAGGMALGLAPEPFTILLGLASFAALLAVLARTSLAMTRDLAQPLPWVSLGLFGVALHAHHRSWATSGLETTLFALWVTATVVTAIEARTRRGWLGVGLLGSLALLTRPEGALIYGLAWLALALGPTAGRPARLAWAAAPGLVLIAPWLAWKLAFYGELLPNTFYAKDADDGDWAQGLIFLRQYFETYWALLPGLAVALAWPFRSPRTGAGWAGPRAPLLIGALVAAWLLHVVRVGGDFMFARFLVPITPLLLIALERALRGLPGRAGLGVGSGVLVGLALASPPSELLALEGLDGVVEERSWYPPEAPVEAARQGAIVREMLAGTRARVVFYGTQAMLMYYGDVPSALEGHVGLTDHALARLDNVPGTRLGHGKKATLEYLRERQVDLVLDFRLDIPTPKLTRIDLGGGVGGRLMIYRRELTRVLADRGARFVDFEAFLDRYIAQMPAMPDDKVAREYPQYKAYYFDHNDDPRRHAPFLARLGLAPEEADDGRRNLVVLMADTLRADRLGAWGHDRPTSPSIDGLAEQGVRFASHHSHSSRTGPSVATLFTGLHPRSHGVINPLDAFDAKGTLTPDQTTLAELLSDQGWATAGFVTNMNVATRFGFGQGFDTYLLRPVARAESVHQAAGAFLDGVGEQPFLLYLHYMETHTPYATGGEGPGPFEDPDYAGPLTGAHEELDAVLRGQYTLTPADQVQLDALYDQAVLQLDTAIGQLLADLDRRGLAEDTVVVLVADHGEELLDHGSLLHGYTLYQEQLHVPLIIRAPGLAPRVVETPSRQVDVLPTLLGLLGVDTALPLQGRDLLGAQSGEPAPIYGSTQLRALWTAQAETLVQDGWKLIETTLPQPGTELFHLAQDPGEARDRTDEEPERVQALREALTGFRDALPQAAGQAVTLEGDELEALRALGYVE